MTSKILMSFAIGTASAVAALLIAGQAGAGDAAADRPDHRPKYGPHYPGQPTQPTQGYCQARLQECRVDGRNYAAAYSELRRAVRDIARTSRSRRVRRMAKQAQRRAARYLAPRAVAPVSGRNPVFCRSL